jgi:hypothetical protein
MHKQTRAPAHEGQRSHTQKESTTQTQKRPPKLEAAITKAKHKVSRKATTSKIEKRSHP